MLARSARGGDHAARAELIRLSLRLVAMRVSNLRVRTRDIDDALQAGTLGLIGAIDRFDPDRGVRLATYAWPWITGSIRTAVTTPSEVLVEAPDPAGPDTGVVDELVGALPIGLADVVRLRFRLGEPDDVPRTHGDVAARLGLSVPQVRRAEAQALSRLRSGLARLGDR
jgi:DNA-directed RNA polymerase sigma subunit (sigma70/sigma32)